MRRHLKVLFISMIPIVEMKGGIPWGVHHGLDLGTATALGILGTCLQIPLNLALMWLLIKFAHRFPLGQRFLQWSKERTAKHEGLINRWGLLGVAILVGVPIPGTGLWTGTVAGRLIGLSTWRITAGLIIGTAMAGVIVAMATAGVKFMIF